jgi:hypothetical protein
MLQRYPPDGGFQAHSNGVKIAHWSDKPLRSTAGFVAIFNGADYLYGTSGPSVVLCRTLTQAGSHN